MAAQHSEYYDSASGRPNMHSSSESRPIAYSGAGIGRNRVSSVLRSVLRPVGHAVFKAIERSGNVYVVKSDEAWELPERRFLKRLFDAAEVDCVFDVGANAGQYAEMLRKKVAYKGPIISFEPIPRMAALLRTKAAGDPNWYVEEVALSDKKGSAPFNVMASDQFSSLANPNHAETGIFKDLNAVSETVQVVTDIASRYFLEYQAKLGFKRPFLKMDTQGHDLAVFSGALDVADQLVGLQSELSIVPIYEGAPGYVKVISSFEKAGFMLGAFVPNNDGHFPQLIETDCIMINKKMGFARPAARK